MRSLPSGTTAVSAWILLSLGAAFSHDTSSRDADVTEAESVQAHARPMDAWGGLVWKRSSTVLLARPWLSDRLDKPDNAADESDVDWYGLFARSGIPRALPAMDVAGQVARSDPDMRRNGGVDRALHSAGDDYSMPANFTRYFDRAMIEYSSGAMLTLGYSTEVGVRRDILYANGYWAEGEFRQLTGSGPLAPGPAGLSFSHVGLGGYRPGLRRPPLDSAGFAVGVQAHFADEEANWALELGHRQEFGMSHSDLGNSGGTALTTRAQYRFAERFLLQFDAYYAITGRDSENNRDLDADTADTSALRVALKVDF